MAIADIDHAAAGRASGRARRAKMLDHANKVEIVESVIKASQRAEIGPELLEHSLNVARTVANAVASLDIDTPLSAKQLAEAAQILHKMARLELGESTSNSATFDVTDRDAQVQALKQRIGELDAEA